MMVPDIPASKEYVSVREAAQIIGCSPQRVYQYVRDGRLSAQHVGSTLILPIEEVQGFKPAPTGRVRVKPTPWHIYRSPNTVIETTIYVPVRAGMYKKLLARFRAFKDEERHTFQGSMARYIVEDESAINIQLIWRKHEMPDDATLQQDLLSFQQEFIELNWEAAQYSSHTVLLHT